MVDTAVFLHLNFEEKVKKLPFGNTDSICDALMDTVKEIRFRLYYRYECNTDRRQTANERTW